MGMEFKRCDLIIPVWNHLEMTADCIASIKKNTKYPYGIILIDNASDEPTRQYLKSLSEKMSAVRVIRNDENKGFVKAVNQGIKESVAPYICVMNNDTVVTEGWLSELVSILAGNADIGLINPSSNTSCQFPGKLDIESYAKTLNALKGKYQELYRCRGFAMVVKKEVVDKIGCLDTTFGMGYFDDIDYSKRAQKLGYRTVRAKAAYVYHKGSQSFSKIKEKDDIFLANEKKFISKWGRQLRVAYVVPGDARRGSDIDRLSLNINRLVKTGHQAWIFTKPGIKKRLNLVDHESIRFFCYRGFLFSVYVLYKIWKRKRKKRLHMILTDSSAMLKLFGAFKNTLGQGALSDDDFNAVERKMRSVSFTT